jgi:hypothetical protein
VILSVLRRKNRVLRSNGEGYEKCQTIPIGGRIPYVILLGNPLFLVHRSPGRKEALGACCGSLLPWPCGRACGPPHKKRAAPGFLLCWGVPRKPLFQIIGGRSLPARLRRKKPAALGCGRRRPCRLRGMRKIFMGRCPKPRCFLVSFVAGGSHLILMLGALRSCVLILF